MDSEDVTHSTLYQKLVEHESQISTMSKDIHGINEKLDPIAVGVTSMAFAFRALLWVGAGSAALVGILEFIAHVQ